MKTHDLIVDVIELVINRLNTEFEEAFKEGRYSDAEQLLTKAWVKVTQVATDLWWNHVISFDEMKFITKRFYAFAETKWEKLHRYETLSSYARDKCSSEAEHPGLVALDAIYQRINNMDAGITMNLQTTTECYAAATRPVETSTEYNETVLVLFHRL